MKNITILLLILILSSCTKTIKCDGILEKSALKKELIKNQVSQKKFYEILGYKTPEKMLKSFFYRHARLDSIKTINSIDDNKCSCKAILKIEFNEKIKEELILNTTYNPLIEKYIAAMKNDYELKYEINKTNKNSYSVNLIKGHDQLSSSTAMYSRLHVKNP
ncbi:hypothetical protein KUL118_61860 [Tenacibaculum sp. KUL118]|uniref:hypothetical protein n=1 Tax=Tenacibaculum sp. XPcli2-G TaxID=2954503 RepID=UPI0012E4E958|nr:hypothetical protein [Tenacibaculum sp. XPcli2-G]MCO7185750.1 hypothetical protein [Tenacibaculum sp. XPcli2-G]GFD83324.1 hypothetical protein KUL118_61860 [Tenacibaculum sp. KUL118]